MSRLLRCGVVVWLVLALAGVACADAPVVLRAGRVLDVRTGELLPERAIVVDGERIRAVVPMSQAPAGARVFDLSRFTVMPGLIDVHTHLTLEPGRSLLDPGETTARRALRGAANARRTLRAGFTTVRWPGAPDGEDVALREAVAAGELEGPRMLVSGPPLGATGSHYDPCTLPSLRDVHARGRADGPWDVRRAVRENVRDGADFIKFCASGGVLQRGGHGADVVEYTAEEMGALVGEAHRLGVPVTVHAYDPASILAALQAGVDGVEHASRIDDEGLRIAARRGVWLVPTLLAFDGLETQSADPAEVRALRSAAEQSVGRMLRAGCHVAFGTDAGVFPHGENARQLALLVKAGMTPLQAVRSATVDAAACLGWGARVGSLEPGLFADIIAVEGDPLRDVSVLERVRFVMQGGRVIVP